MAWLPKGASWSDYLKFITENPRHDISWRTGDAIKAGPKAEVPKMVPPSDIWSDMAARATQLAQEKATQAKVAGQSATDYLTKPQPVLVNGQKQLIRDPVTGRMTKEVETAFTPGQQAARIAAPAAGATGLAYLAAQAGAPSAANHPPIDEVSFQYGTNKSVDPRSNFNDEDAVPNPLRNANNFDDQNAIPNPSRVIAPAERTALGIARRQAAPALAPAPAAAPVQDKGFLSGLFSGPDYQSNSRALVSQNAAQGLMQAGKDRGPVHVNWGDSDNAADFFRAEKAMRDAQASGQDVTGMSTGGTAKPHKDAALHKALEIIHHLISRR